MDWFVALADHPGAPVKEVFPVLVPEPGATSSGLLLHGLERADWLILDAFEDDLYDLCPITLDGDREALVFACSNPRQTLPDPWDRAAFECRQLDSYVARCVAWRRRHAPGLDG